MADTVVAQQGQAVQPQRVLNPNAWLSLPSLNRVSGQVSLTKAIPLQEGETLKLKVKEFRSDTFDQNETFDIIGRTSKDKISGSIKTGDEMRKFQEIDGKELVALRPQS